ncbi:DUF6364 family protein [Streptoalloteichus hindustanus]|uniref:Ribbon-helix-helix protein, copG family n=1 Tax=Streptoalloteichus hindustanus TaxID=2017 RepID=A0A1M5K895_STRHI|nr:DUF6364 family protein [Streptoalloteichus hindustanus]SHG48393.1 hypothetical protein SAMN05444320_109160 [Streptoalloteichus hindustanus]
MAKQNLTVQLDEDVIRRAKAAAARRGMSLSSLIARDVRAIEESDERYERAKQVAFDALANAVDRGGRSWRREDLHDR